MQTTSPLHMQPREAGRPWSEPAPGGAEADATVAPEDEARAGFYGLIANLLAAPPHPMVLTNLACARPLEADKAIAEAQALALAWDGLCATARELDAAEVEAEWQALFTGTGRPPVVLHGSWYLTGFMMEKPLAALREDLAALGMARRAHCGESEDHLAAVCDVMRVLAIDGGRPPGARIEAQRRFFDRHIRPWASDCCATLAVAPEARFFAAVGKFAGAFLALEGRALEIES